MLYFIPAWYQQNTWSENEQYWYRRRMHTEFDDTVKQVQLFHRNGTNPYSIMLLSFSPNFRHFLHRQGVYHAPYWSCFDAMQEIHRNKTMVLSFHNLNWPKGIEFVYTSFVVLAYLKGERYAQIEFGEDGNPIQIDIFREEEISRRNIYDDRGFVSSTIIYEKGKAVYQDYLMENGIWKFRHFMQDGHVEINPACPNYLIVHAEKEFTHRYKKLYYESMEAVMGEVLHEYLTFSYRDDIFCVAMHQRNVGILQEALKDKHTILSFFEDRYDVSKEARIDDMVIRADYIITDSEVNLARVKSTYGENVRHIRSITPYDTRMDFGISQQLAVQKILIPVDGVVDELFGNVVLQTAEYMQGNKHAQVHLFSRNGQYHVKQQLLERTRSLLEEHGYPKEWAEEEQKENVRENMLDDENVIPKRFFVEQCVDEREIAKCMREQRIIVDLREKPELYLQIMAISTGIPQVVIKETPYVEHMVNGYIVGQIDEIPKTLSFYLDSLGNWNQSAIGCYEIGKRFTTKVLLDAWKEVLETIG